MLHLKKHFSLPFPVAKREVISLLLGRRLLNRYNEANGTNNSRNRTHDALTILLPVSFIGYSFFFFFFITVRPFLLFYLPIACVTIRCINVAGNISLSITSVSLDV